ncbi:unnamed protein product [Fusarium venenatum]|uniref:Uncharacterized protein n=1 Tax=Fusarium venenatum TaxID=56646 RepID=A0A2L2T7P5_9HYPO|nr:uncharacterized protein FVRRES_02450 [Fusarium venenatum]CEI65938.1 unnamed protein product [Fusarium venenatum]
MAHYSVASLSEQFSFTVLVAAAQSWHGTLEEGDPESLVLPLRLLLVIPESDDVLRCSIVGLIRDDLIWDTPF